MKNYYSTIKEKFVKFLRRKGLLYHRILSLIIALPLLLWCLSGIMHPFMSHWFKPQIKNTALISTVKADQLKLPVQDVLSRNNILQVSNIKIVAFGGQHYYQVKGLSGQWSYYSAADGKELADGDQKYAMFLARHFSGDTISSISAVEKVKHFSQTYKYVNRLLPVYRVRFDSDKALDVYVETSHSRLATFTDRQRRAFLWFFDTFHNWSWLGQITNWYIREALIVVLMALISLSAISGLLLYGIFWSLFNTNNKLRSGRLHRRMGLAVAAVMLAFAVSGAVHLLGKQNPGDAITEAFEQKINADELQFDLRKQASRTAADYNMGLVRFGGAAYYQVFTQDEDHLPTVRYLNAATGIELKDGNPLYAKELAKRFLLSNPDFLYNEQECCLISAAMLPKVKDVRVLYDYESREYGFVFKRLPVVRVSFETQDNIALFIEPATSRLAATITDGKRREGYTFAILHKFILLDWAGKNIRDIILVLSALGVAATLLTGVLLLLNRRRLK